MSGKKSNPQTPFSPLDPSLWMQDFNGDNGEIDFNGGSEYVYPNANIPSNNVNSNLDPALANANQFALPTANALQRLQAPPAMPQYASSDSTNIADLPRPTDKYYHPLIGWYYPVPTPADLSRPGNLYFHPQVGWYVPVEQSVARSVGLASPAFMGQTPNNQYSFPGPASVPAAPVAPAACAGRKRKDRDEDPSRENSSRSQKRKYGPVAYLEEQTNKRAQGDNSAPSLSHRQSINYGGPPASRVQTPEQKQAAREAKAAAKTAVPRKTSKLSMSTKKIGKINAAIVQACTCAAAQQTKANHIKRPKNKFFVFRAEFSARYPASKGKGKKKDQTNVSKAAGDAWRALGPAGQEAYADRAAADAAAHKQRHPDYVYNPQANIEARFGQSDCKCGAYQANMAELASNEGEGELETIDEDDEAEDTITVAQPGPMTRSRSRSLSRSRAAQGGLLPPPAQLPQTPYFAAPAAQANQLPDFMNNGNYNQYDYNFGLPDGETLPELTPDLFHIAGYTPPQQQNGESPPLRRSPRTASKSVHYTEPAVEGSFDDVAFWAQWTDKDAPSAAPKSPSPKRRPTPISTSRKSSGLSELNTSDPRLEGMSSSNLDGPATRTRSKSLSMSPASRNLLAGLDEEGAAAMQDEVDLESLFGSAGGSRKSSKSNGTPKSATSSKASPKTTRQGGLMLPGQSTRVTRSQSRGRSRKRS